MDTQTSLQIIEQALDIASTKGAFKLAESNTILTALNTLKNALQTPVTDKEIIRTVSEDK
jgi:hypothetical protein